MKKLALSDEILLKIDKPARCLGNEINAVIKDPEQVDIRFCMCFPDVYEKYFAQAIYSVIIITLYYILYRRGRICIV